MYLAFGVWGEVCVSLNGGYNSSFGDFLEVDSTLDNYLQPQKLLENRATSRLELKLKLELESRRRA